ncbi:alpha/beta fold hydrolase [Candidatus Chloroploca sp. M-50]|uniref:Alpha/beta fold hydrolase n=1 Tax=Candidatus Chloroploca mongolica TaxID=2528176 RepID=A0ABS4D4N5_9CHLR|nr:alpha/beta fold hydrolase [Candidatus Chloroploca mongolica]MBP1464397.1 alpha/beta fold hydrolase [Candidatus Chloroploca mongolica]
MPTFTIDGTRIYAREEGPRTGQICLLIHGWSSSWYAMSPLLPILSRRFHCLAVDLPGYGNSERLPTRTTIMRYVDLLAKLVQEFTDSPATLIGHSMGGMISITMALRYPQLIDRMVLLAPTISGQLSAWITYAIAPITMLERHTIADRLVSAMEPSLLRITDRLMRPASFAERSAISEADYLRLRADARRPGQGRVRAECYTAMRDNDLRGRLRNLETPALVIWGAEDNTVPLRDAGVVADEWVGADLRIVPKAGHWPQFETPEFTWRMLASYLALPLITTRLEDSTTSAVITSEVATFLANSDLGSGLSLAQRTRLAGLMRRRVHQAGAMVAEADEACTDLYLIQDGSVEVWTSAVDEHTPPRQLATVLRGQLTGEMALIDGGRRSAALRAGLDGAVVLVLQREQLRALVEDDPALGNAVVWNLASSLALRLRLANFQMQMLATQLQGGVVGETV